jgi:hypothetical protein
MTKYEGSKFGNGISSLSAGGNVVVASGAPHNTFGPRDTGGSTGVLKVEGAIEQFRLEITGDDLNDLLEPLVPTYIPAGALIRDAWWNTVEVFVATGTSPTLLVGTDTSEVTNGLVVNETALETLGTTRVTGTLTGTWAVSTPLAARTKVGFAIGGSNSPAIARSGRGILTVEYIRPALDV